MSDELALSCIFPPSLQTPEHIALAEDLGYRRAWCYDSPAMYADPWMVLALAAERTTTIALGPAVLVPSLRHPMVNAAALATLAALAPGRVCAAFGTGLTGRMLLGERPMRWAEVAEYVRALAALLRGEDVEWQGKTLRMLQPDGFAPARPVDVELMLGADGPLGAGIADELGATIFASRLPSEPDGRVRTVLTFGTVLEGEALEDGEQLSDPRVVAAAGPAVAAAYHSMYESRGAAGVARVPGGEAWVESIEAVDESRRHLSIHEGHLVELNPRDAATLAEATSLIAKWTTTGSATDVAARLEKLRAAGASEIAYQPMGDDIARELRSFAAAAQKVGA